MRLTSIFTLAIVLWSHFPLHADIFDTLRAIPKARRIGDARDIYKKELRRVDSVTAFRGFAQLFDVARSLDDRSLECSVYDLQADYFSVNRGFNKLSLAYYKKAIEMAGQFDLPVEQAIHTYKLGTFFNTFGRYAEANRYLLESYDLFKAVGFENVPRIGQYLHDISGFYFRLGDIETAYNFIMQAIQDKNCPDLELAMTNTLALIHQELGHEKEALIFFSKALGLAKVNHDSIWIGIISDNIGAIYVNRGQYDSAVSYLAVGYEECLRHGDARIAAQAGLFLARCSMSTGNTESAAAQIKLVEPLVKQVNIPDRWMMYYETLAQLSERTGNPRGALTYWKEYDKAKDSLERMKNVAAVNRVKLQWEMDKSQLQLGQLQTQARTEVVKRNFVIALLFLLMIISILMYNRQLMRKKNEVSLLEKQDALLKSEKARAEEELSNATRSLAQYTENVRQKNDLIEGFKAEVENLQHQLGVPADPERIEYLEKLMQAHLMTDETWHEFQKLFEKVHRGFLYRLKERFIFATETDIRLLALIKLGLNNREMANMLGVTTEAVKKSRQRLRKKIELPEAETLERVVALI